MTIPMPDVITTDLRLVHAHTGRTILSIDHVPPADTGWAPRVTLWADPTDGTFVGGRYTTLTTDLLATVALPARWTTEQNLDDRFA